MYIVHGKINDFKPFEKVGESNYCFNWGQEQIKETSHCSYETCSFYGFMPSYHMITFAFNKGERVPSMSEMKTIGVSLEMTEEEMIPWMKEQLKRAIAKHDKSRGTNGVENFTINGVNLWLDKDTRTGLLLRFQAEKAQGKTDTVLWNDGMQFPLVIEQGIQMLYAIEVYASETYDLKESLLAEADKLESVDELIAFDKTRTSGYPAHLAF